MLNLKNDVGSLEELIEKKKRVILYGAGASAKLLLKSFYDILPAGSREFLVDGNEGLDGQYCEIDESHKIRIISLKSFCERWGGKAGELTLLFTPYSSLFIIKTLDSIEALDQVEAYVYSFIVNKMPPKTFGLRETRRPRIPKIIHYFWVGNAPMPEEYRRNIDSWRRYCPDYEIMEWNESNYDFSRCRYGREALEARQYMYATDGARKDVLYTYGGIYFDTDVELLRPIDELLYHEAFIGIDDGGQLNSGSGLGCVKGHPVVKEMLELYEDKAFIKEDGSFNLHFNTLYETELMIAKGYRVKNEYQRIQGVSCFPREVFMPEGTVGVRDNYTEHTVSNHKINPYDKARIQSVVNRLYGKRELVLYGAGMVAVSVFYAIKALYRDCEVIAFLVSNKEGNPVEIAGIPVLSVQEFQGFRPAGSARILIAAPENHHAAIAAELEKRNLKDYIFIDSKKEAGLMERYYKEINRFPSLRSYPPGNEKASIEVYMARFHRDKPLKSSYKPPWWVRPVQAGAALTGERVADLRDDEGDNLSKKNGNYSELTAMYWVGRHGGLSRPEDSLHTYLGLFHYRRILDVTEEDLYRLREHDIDVVLPYPTIHDPSAYEHHRRYVKEGDWEAMIQALKELAPEYEKSMSHIFSRPYFYNYNMLIAKEGIFRDYCDWLFPILRRTEELSSPKGWERADRYIGYLGENLTTLYFMYHQDDFRIAHTGRLMLI